ncbi:MAG: hypothetical protein KDM81_18200 [Verrucomicrobiae bacterium]|nr:hypothetical protein [Verrucomicrobiae bacterium]
MTTKPSIVARRRRADAGSIILALLLLLALAAAWAVVDCLRMDRDGRALREAVIKQAGVDCARQFQAGVGPVLLGGARLGLRFLPDLPPQARRALDALRGARVSVDRIEGRIATDRLGGILRAADRTMDGRGWDRLAGIVDGDTLVVVYVERGLRRGTTMQTRVAVIESEQLIVVSARADLEPLVELAFEQMNAELAAHHPRR